MNFSKDYVLVLNERRRQVHQPEFPVASAQYSFIVVPSVEDAIEQARKVTPCLVILIGESHAWFENQVKALRHALEAPSMTVVALTDSTAPNWQASKETMELDGFLVKPLTDDILVSLVQSAIVKQSYRQSA